MPIPAFTEKGLLPEGIHLCSGQEFTDRFCHTKKRKEFTKSICDIFDFTRANGGAYLFIGGSFIQETDDFHDLDCIIVFYKDEYIPRNIENIALDNLDVDILYTSLEHEEDINSFLKLFSISKLGNNCGLIQVGIYTQSEEWTVQHEPDPEIFEIVKRHYHGRVYLIEKRKPKGLLISIHGLFSSATWNTIIAPVASNQGWVFAPYVYCSNTPLLLISKRKRQKAVDDFRTWFYDITERYSDLPISIIAHSFGTYIIGTYLRGFETVEFPPKKIDSVILTGSILPESYPWDKVIGHSVGSVYNTIAPNDQWVRFMPQGRLGILLNMTESFGKSGINGFSYKGEYFIERSMNILHHNNSIERDIIETQWMPHIQLMNKYNALVAQQILKLLAKDKSI